MRTLAAALLAVALGAATAAAQQPASTGADQPQSQTQTQTGARHRWGMTHHFKGTVQSVEPASGSITVRDKKGRTETFQAGSSVKITRGRAAVSLDSLNVGDQVSVSYKGKKTAPQVERVKIREKTSAR